MQYPQWFAEIILLNHTVVAPPPPLVKQLESNGMKFLNRTVTRTIKTFKAPKQGTLPPEKNTSHRLHSGHLCWNKLLKLRQTQRLQLWLSTT